MSAGSVNFNWNSQHQAIMQGFQLVHSNLDQMNAKINQVGNAQRRQNEQHKEGWDSVIGSIGRSITSAVGFGSVVAGIYTTVRMIGDEWKKNIAAQEKYERLRSGSGISFGEMNVNFLPDAEGVKGGIRTFDQLQAMKSQTKQKTLLNEDQINQVLTDSLSARGGLTIPEMNEFVIAAGELLPGNAEGINTLAARGMDISKVTGNRNAKQIIASILEVQAASRATKTEDLAENIITPMMAMMGKGATWEEGGEFFAGLTQVTGDASPEKSRTASIRFMRELNEFVPERGAKDKIGNRLKITKEMMDEYAAAREQSPAEQVRVLQKYPDLGEAFLTKAGSIGKGAMLPAFEGLIRNNPRVQAQFDSAQEKIGALGNEQALSAFDERTDNLRNSKVFQTFAAQKQIELGEEEVALSDAMSGAARTSQIRQLLQKTVDDHMIKGLEGYEDAATMTTFETQLELGKDPYDAAKMQLSNIKRESEDPKEGYKQVNAALDVLDRMQLRYNPGTNRNAQNHDRNNRGPQAGNPQ